MKIVNLNDITTTFLVWLFLDIVTAWTKHHRTKNMSYKHGFLTVGVSGYYYIYSQLYYFDTTWTMGHIMYINDKVVLKAIRSFGNVSDSQQTMYIGGVFEIEAHSKIHVKVANEKFMHFNNVTSFFGAFMVSAY